MAELDHIIFAAPNLDDGVRIIEKLTGAKAVPGGVHVDRGTHNALLTFDDRTYFEVIGIDPGQPSPKHEPSFGLRDRTAPALAGFAIHPTGAESLDDLAAAMTNAGFEPGPVVDMSRRKPDGSLLEWRLTIGSGNRALGSEAIPFAIDWGAGSSPATSLPSMGRLVSLAVFHPDPAVRAGVDSLGIGVEVHDGPARLVATVDTPNGVIEIT